MFRSARDRHQGIKQKPLWKLATSEVVQKSQVFKMYTLLRRVIL